MLTPEVYWGGMALTLFAVLAIALVLWGHRYAPTVGMAVGLWTKILVAASHLLPWSSNFSDAFPGSHVDLLSWLAVLGDIGGALAFGGASAWALRCRRRVDRF